VGSSSPPQRFKHSPKNAASATKQTNAKKAPDGGRRRQALTIKMKLKFSVFGNANDGARGTCEFAGWNTR
jgi:hypothetical protein